MSTYNKFPNFSFELLRMNGIKIARFHGFDIREYCCVVG